jgi:RNA-binding protein YlmH
MNLPEMHDGAAADDVVITSIEEEIPASLDDVRLDRVVALVADVSRTVAAELVGAGAVRINDVPATSGKERVRRGHVGSTASHGT